MQGKHIRNKKSVMIFLIALGFASVILRLYSTGAPDFYFDEAIQAMSIKDFIATGDFSYLYLFGHPPLFMILMYFPAMLFGVNEASVRLVDAVSGILAVFAVYFLARIWFGKSNAMLASLLFAVAPLPALYGRLAYGYSLSMFFTIASILSIECLIRTKAGKKHEILLILISGILVGLTFLARYNSLPIFGLYWLFLLSYSFLMGKKYFKRYFCYAVAIHLTALAFFLAVVLAFGGFSRLVYVAHNFLFVILQQSTEIRNPFYYHIAVLFDGISPFLYAALPFALVYLLAHKKRTRADIMLSFIVIAFFIIITIQARRFSRHQLVIYPFLIILLSRFITEFSSNYLKKKQAIAFSFIIILGTLSWTILSIYQTHDFNVWSEVGDYIEKNYDSSVKVHSGYIRNRQIKAHLLRSVDISQNISQLNKNDLVIFAFLHENTTILENSPFEDKSTLFKNEFAAKRNKGMEFNPDYYKYVLEHGSIVNSFDYNGGTAVWIYKINDVKDKNLYANTGFIDVPQADTGLFGLWGVICNNWNKNNLIDLITKRITSMQQKKEINAKCLK